MGSEGLLTQLNYVILTVRPVLSPCENDAAVFIPAFVPGEVTEVSIWQESGSRAKPTKKPLCQNYRNV